MSSLAPNPVPYLTLSNMAHARHIRPQTPNPKPQTPNPKPQTSTPKPPPQALTVTQQHGLDECARQIKCMAKEIADLTEMLRLERLLTADLGEQLRKLQARYISLTLTLNPNHYPSPKP